jgi:exopolysaccharide biosynthesis polyprenyl glycosylphosphotransferase
VSASPETAGSHTADALTRAAAKPRAFVRRGWFVRRLLLTSDVLAISLAFLLAEFFAELRGGEGGNFGVQAELLLFVAALPCWILAAKLVGLYDRDCERTDHSTFDDAASVFHLITGVAWLIVVVAWATEIAYPDFEKLLLFWAFSIVLVVGGRVAVRAVARRTRAYRQNTLIVGAGELGGLIARKIRNHPEYGLDLVGYVDGASNSTPDGAPLLGAPGELSEVIAAHEVERVIVAFLDGSSEETLGLVRTLKDHDVQIDLVPRLHEVVFPGASIHTLEGLPLLGLPRFGLSRSSALIKRAMDVTVSVLALVALAPLFVLISVLIKLDSPGPIFFRQVRMGCGGTTFRIYKFRSMTLDADERKADTVHLNMHSSGDARMFKIPQDPRVTRVGRFLRRSSLDELPQLINVLRGEMSLVGPRPLILEEAEHVREWARKRLDLRPGITGLWQVLGRSDIPFREMTQLDYRYVMTWSPWTDVRLLFQTLPAVLRKRGAY